MVNPEFADIFVRTCQSKPVLDIVVRKEGGIKVDAHTAGFGKLHPFYKMLGLQLIAVGKVTVVKYGIAGMKIKLLFLGQNAKQEIFPAKEGDIAVNFIILPEFFDKTLEMLGSEETPVKNFLVEALFRNENPGYLHFKVADVLLVQNLIENLLWSLIGKASNKRNINQTTMGLLFMQLLNHTDRLAYNSKEEGAVIGIIKYIEENYKKGSLTEVARFMHYYFYWLSHEIKKSNGKDIH